MALAGRLSTSGVVVAGLGGMLGAGVFAGLPAATAAAGAGASVLAGTVLAWLLATSSVFASWDQSRASPRPGTGHRTIARRLGRWPGRMAASAAIGGRIAAAAGVAGTFGHYLMPDRPLVGALGVITVTSGVQSAGLRVGVRLNRVVVALVLAALALAVVVCFAVPPPPPAVVTAMPGTDQSRGLFTAAGTMIVAYLGFDRVAPPDPDGEHPAARRWGAAVVTLLTLALGCCLAVGSAVLRQLGPIRFGLSPAPLRDAVVAADGAAVVPVVVVGAAVATLSALWLMLSESRHAVTAVAADGHLPDALAADRLACWASGAVAAVVVTVVGPVAAISFAACCVLASYAFGNASACVLLGRGGRMWPACTACCGLGLAVLLWMKMPPAPLAASVCTVVGGGALLAVGTRFTRRPRPSAEPRGR